MSKSVRVGFNLNNRSGAILIVTLWMLVILTVFALALGERASLEVKLAKYQRDELKAIELAESAIERAIWEKRNDTLKETDALSESWANNESAFKDFELGEGTFSVSYPLDETFLYGLEDEESKININFVSQSVLKNLFEDYDNADEIVVSIVAWRSKTVEPEEEDYYQGLDLPYHCKDEEFKSVAELLLVRGITPEILYGEDKGGDGIISEDEKGLAQYLTVYGEGKVNINTASEKVLRALINDVDLLDKIIFYRKGLDGIAGTVDDRWFSTEETTVNLAGEPAKNLKADYIQDIFFDVTLAQWQKLKNLQTDGKLSVSSKTYTIHAQANLKKIKKSIHATVDLTDPAQIKCLDWHRN